MAPLTTRPLTARFYSRREDAFADCRDLERLAQRVIRQQLWAWSRNDPCIERLRQELAATKRTGSIVTYLAGSDYVKLPWTWREQAEDLLRMVWQLGVGLLAITIFALLFCAFFDKGVPTIKAYYRAQAAQAEQHARDECELQALQASSPMRAFGCA